MEGFTYSDIFATKGMEYLVIIAFLALLIPFSIVLNKQLKVSGRIRKAIGIITANLLKIPQGLFFSRNHTWMFLEKNGLAKVGLDDFLLHMTGEVKITHLKKPGEMIHRGELLTEMEQDGKRLRIYSPVTGTVRDTNALLPSEPGLLNEDPYGKGWIYKIKPTDWKEEVRSCFLAEEATSWSENELVRFKDFLAMTTKNQSHEPSMVILQDGGELADHSLTKVNDDVWQGFQKEFLNL
jgi:glycine cleavage system H protein